jgi:hypothetical protein
MRTRTTLAAVALTVLAAGCGQQQPTPRQAVASYLRHVNRIESALTRPLSTVTSAGNQFAQEQARGGTLTNLVTASHRQALLGAWSQIVALRARLSAVKAPPAAARLRVLLLQIIDGQAALTRELAQLVDFLPRFSDAMRPLAPATRQLELALAQQSTSSSAGAAAAYASKAAALRQFKHAVDKVVAHLHGLQPPPVSHPQYQTELTSLEGMSSSAGRLGSALVGGQQGSVQPLLAAFDRAASLNQTTAAQKAQIAAVRAYDGETTRLQQLSQAAEEERLRLANTLS